MELTIGIPAYNEEKNIGAIIIQLKKIASKIIVCDDGSTDSTNSIAKELGAIVISHSKNQGYGATIRSIFLKAKEIDADILVTSLSPIKICPSVTISSPAIKRSVVVLPHPDGPSKVTS